MVFHEELFVTFKMVSVLHGILDGVLCGVLHGDLGGV